MRVSRTLSESPSLTGCKNNQVIDAVVGEYRSEVRINEKTGGKKYNQVTVCDAPLEERVFRRVVFVHTR